MGGVCHTYDPPFNSYASQYHGIRIGIRFSFAGSAISEREATGILRWYKMFLHDKGKFIYHE